MDSITNIRPCCEQEHRRQTCFGASTRLLGPGDSVSRCHFEAVLLAVLAHVNLLVWLFTGIFSASVTATGGEGLLVGKCGWMSLTANKEFPLWTQDDWEDGDALFVAAYNGYRDNMAYTNTWYDTLCDNTDARRTVPTVPYIESTFDHDAPCPFASSMCAGPMITMDSGLIDSDTKLGTNGPVKDRLHRVFQFLLSHSILVGTMRLNRERRCFYQ